MTSHCIYVIAVFLTRIQACMYNVFLLYSVNDISDLSADARAYIPGTCGLGKVTCTCNEKKT